MYGYRTADAYYRHFSLVNRFPNIKVPMLCISAEDDGVCHLKGLGKEELLHNGNTILCLAKAGGHIGFLEGWRASEIWFPKPAMEFLSYFIN
jgi:predicted alpha/beta-fold hydrolase